MHYTIILFLFLIGNFYPRSTMSQSIRRRSCLFSSYSLLDCVRSLPFWHCLPTSTPSPWAWWHAPFWPGSLPPCSTSWTRRTPTYPRPSSTCCQRSNQAYRCILFFCWNRIKLNCLWSFYYMSNSFKWIWSYQLWTISCTWHPSSLCRIPDTSKAGNLVRISDRLSLGTRKVGNHERDSLLTRTKN